MNPEELRIKNIVCHEDDGEIVEGIHYFDTGYKILIGNHLRPIEEIKPVALTSEWLERFGFERKGQFKSWDINYPFLTWEQTLTVEGDKGFTAYVTTDNGKSASISNILYVHQLQNLYFALTGHELQISAPTPE